MIQADHQTPGYYTGQIFAALGLRGKQRRNVVQHGVPRLLPTMSILLVDTVNTVVTVMIVLVPETFLVVRRTGAKLQRGNGTS